MLFRSGLLVFIDSVTGGQGSLGNLLNYTDGGRLNNMTGTRLPIAPPAFPGAGPDLDYDFVYEINGGLSIPNVATSATYWVDFNDITTTGLRRFLGLNNVNSNGSQFFSDPANSNGFYMAYNFSNNDGVTGCGDGNACDLMSNAAMAGLAATADYGFEMAVPLADIEIGRAHV